MKKQKAARAASEVRASRAETKPRAEVQQGWKAWHWALLALGALVVAAEVYSPALRGPFLLDDLYLPYGLPNADQIPIGQWFSQRPLLGATFLWNFRLSGTDSYSYHVLNVVLHWVTSVLVFFLVRYALLKMGTDRSVHREASVDSQQHVVGDSSPFQARWLPIFGAALFLLHPIQTEAVAYIASRSDVLSTLFSYAALLVFLQTREPAIRLGSAVAVLGLTACAALSKEQAAALPAVFVLINLCWRDARSFVASITRNWKLYAPMLLGGIAGAALVLRTLHFADTAGFNLQGLTWYQYFFTQCRVFWLYVQLIVLPLGQNVDHDFAISRTIADRGTFLYMAALLALIGAAWWQRRRLPLAFLGLLIMLIFLAPTSSFLPIRDVVAERRLYGPMLGIVFIAVDVIRQLNWNRGIAAGMVVALVALAFLTNGRAALYGSELALWSDAVSKSPEKQRPRFQLASAYYNIQQCGESAREFAKAASLGRQDSRLLLDWALALDCAGQPEEAVAKLERARNKENTAHVASQIGMIRGKQGKWPEALAALDAAEKADPNFAMTYVYRGNVWASQGDWAKAAAEYRNALQREPSNPAAIAAIQSVPPQYRQRQ